MSKIILEVDDSALDKVMWFLEQLRDVVTIDTSMMERDFSNDPLALELQRRVKEIDDGTVELMPHSEVMSKMYAKWEQKCV